MLCSTFCRSAPTWTGSRRRRQRLNRSDTAPWDDEGQSLLNDYVETQPFLVRISAAKKLRDRVERDARQAGEDRVTAERVTHSLALIKEGQFA